MKKFFTLIVLVLTTNCMFAGWQPNDNEMIRLDKAGASGQIQLKTARTPEGRTVLTWLRWSEGLGYEDPSAGYYLYLQVFDVDGTPLLGEGGTVVSNQATLTYTTDYGLAVTSNGDIVITYTDVRTDAGNKERTTVYAYRYDQEGHPVWNADGVRLKPTGTSADGYEMVPLVCTSDDNIYVGFYHVEGEETNFQLQRINDDGTMAWSNNVQLSTDMVVMHRCVDGDLYLIYSNAGMGLDAQRINKDGVSVWGKAVTIENEALGSMFMPDPCCAVDGNGGLFLSYRKLMNWSGYQVMNHLSADGEVLDEAVSCNGNFDGDAGSAIMAARGDMMLVAWQYEFSNPQICVNMMDVDGEYLWLDGKEHGFALGANDMWGLSPMAVIPQDEAWVVVYMDNTSWNGGRLKVSKINYQGEPMWTRRLAASDITMSDFSVTSDENNAYIFFTEEEQYDDKGEPIPGTGGMFVMCVAISQQGTGIKTHSTTDNLQYDRCYDLQGRRLPTGTAKGMKIVKRADGTAVKYCR